MRNEKECVTLDDPATLTCSAAVKAAGFVFASGVRSAREDIRAQTSDTLDRLARVLEAAGSSLQRALNVHVYLRRAADFAVMNEVYAARWRQDPPARTTILADLASPDALVEMSAVAVPNGADRRIVHPRDWLDSPNPYSYAVQSGD